MKSTTQYLKSFLLSPKLLQNLQQHNVIHTFIHNMWKSRICGFILAVVFIGVQGNVQTFSQAQRAITESNNATKPITESERSSDASSSFCVQVRSGIQLGISGKNFIDKYVNYLSVPESPSFNTPFSYGVTLTLDRGNVRYGLDVERFTTGFQQSAEVTVRDAGGAVIGNRSLVEDLNLSCLPTIAYIEFAPVLAQFHTFYGVGAGVNFASLNWNEKVSSDIVGDRRVGGTLISESKVIPALRFHTGIHLGYDRQRSGKDHFGSLVIQLRYTYMPYTTEPFRVLGLQEPRALAQNNEEFTIGASSLSLQLGIEFNLTRLK